MTHGQIEHADDRQARNGTEERTIDPRRAAARRAAGVAQPGASLDQDPATKKRKADEAKRRRQLADLEAARKRLNK